MLGRRPTAADASEMVSAARSERPDLSSDDAGVSFCDHRCEGFPKLESRSFIHKYLVIMFLTLLKGASETFKSPENGAPNRRTRYRLMAIRSVAIPRMRISMP